MTTPQRLEQKARAQQLLGVALALSEQRGYTNVTHDAIADSAKVSRGLVVHYLGAVPQMRRDIMRAALTQQNARVVAQGLAAGDRHAAKAPPELKRKASKLVAG